MGKRLYRSRTNKMIGGICGGIGEYLNMDATVIRTLYVIVSIFSAAFPGILVYLVLMFVIPAE